MQVAWAHAQVKKAYMQFVMEFDRLTEFDVVWEPYSQDLLGARAPYGLSLWCTNNPGLWLTTATLVYDIYAEPHCPDRVMRQFGRRQPFPLPSAMDRISRRQHR
jgi:Plant mobile domain